MFALNFDVNAIPQPAAVYPNRFRGVALLALGIVLGAGSAGPRAAAADVHVEFADSAIVVAPGESFTAHVVIRNTGAEFNAFDASVRFDPDLLSFETAESEADQRGELMTAACANTFHRFRAGPDSLRITLSLLCSKKNVAGPGRLYAVRFRAGLLPGATTLSLGPFTEFYRAGLFVRPVHRRNMIVTIEEPSAGGSKRPPGAAPESTGHR